MDFTPSCIRTKTALQLLIQNSLDMQSSDFGREERKKYEGTEVSFIDSWCTVRLCGPRRTGHTTAMIEVGHEMFKSPLFLFHNEGAMKLHKNDFKLRKYECDNFASIHSLQRYMIGRSYDAVFIDCAFALSKTAESEIKHLCVPCRAMFDKFCLVYIQ
jgi:hypothetical protein